MRSIRRRGDAGDKTIGKLRKGGKKRLSKNGNKIFGEDLNHFRFDAGGDENGPSQLEKDFSRIYGDTPNNILILFSGEIDSVWSSYYETYDSKGNVKQRHDGERVLNWMDGQGLKFANNFEDNPYAKFETWIKVPPDKCPAIDPTAKQVGRLNFMVHGLGRFGGSIVFETHSINDIISIDDYLEKATNMFGTIVNIPFLLMRGMQKISTPDTDNFGKLKSEKRVIREKSMVRVEVHPDWFMNWEASQRIKLGLHNVPLALLEQRSVDLSTGEIMGEPIMMDDYADYGDDADDDLDGDVGFYGDSAGDTGNHGELADFREIDDGMPDSAPVPDSSSSAVDEEFDKKLFTVLGPKWNEFKDKVMAVWKEGDLLQSVADKEQLKVWRLYLLGRGEMPQPSGEAQTAQEAIDNAKVPV